MSSAMPALSFSHGSGMGTGVSDFLTDYIKSLPRIPAGVVVVEAHMEAEPLSVAGDETLAATVVKYLTAAGIVASAKSSRFIQGHGLRDAERAMRTAHGEAVPFVAMSVLPSESAKAHLALGQALSPLREEGILLLGSGIPTFHNFELLRSAHPRFGAGVEGSHTFESWLRATLREDSDSRLAKLNDWQEAPCALTCHPSGGQEHFVPTLVIAAAANGAQGRAIFEESHKQILKVAPHKMSHYEFRSEPDGPCVGPVAASSA